MGGKRVSIKKVEPLILDFSDGTSKKALFNNEAFILFTEEFGPMDEIFEDELQTKPYDCMAKILYVGMKVVDRSVTLDEAMSIVIGGGTDLLMAIGELLIDNFLSTSNDDAKKKFYQELERMSIQLLEG